MGEEGRQFPVGTSGIGVFRAVAAQYGVLVSAVRGKSRTRAVTDARHMSWYLLRKLFGWSMMEIAAFSDVDHSTVLAGFKRMELLIETEQLASVITRLEAARAHLHKEESAAKVPFHVAGAIALLRKSFRCDGAEGESVHLLCDFVDPKREFSEAVWRRHEHVYRQGRCFVCSVRKEDALEEEV